jgi:hypothetical protein
MKLPIDRHLAALLYEQECVVVPGLGAFLVYRENAQIDHVQGLIHPPSKNVRYNGALKEDDADLFVGRLVRAEGLSPEAASESLSEAVAEIHAALAQKSTVRFEKVGKLYQDLEGNIRFVSEGTNFDRYSYGLPVLRFYPILRQQMNTPETPSTKPGPAVSSSRSSFSRGALVAASVTFLLALSAIVWLSGGGSTDAVENPRNQEAALVSSPSSGDSGSSAPVQALEQTVAENAAAPPAEQVPLDVWLAAEEDDADDDNEDVAAKKKKKKDGKPEKTFSEDENRQMAKKYLDDSEPSGSWVIIVGSFSQASNAKRISDKLLKEKFTPFTDGHKGLNRVGVRLNCSVTELEKHLATIRRKINKGAWVLER